MSGQAHAATAVATLWDGWRVTERVDEEVVIEGLRLRRVGLTAEDAHGHVVVGSAATLDDSAVTRAEFELVERAGLVDAASKDARPFPTRARDGRAIGMLGASSVFPASPTPARWQESKSSGAAIGRDWAAACRHAELELVERDRVLRSWWGIAPPPRAVAMPDGPWNRLPSHAWQARVLPPEPGVDEDVVVACIIGFPRVGDAPLLRGFAAARDLETARHRALLECLQSLAFLWGEVVPSDAPTPVPSPLYHLDYYLWPGAHALLRRWLDGDAPARATARPAPARASSTRAFVDLTPASATERIVLVRALDADALRLGFGEPPTDTRLPASPPHPVA